MVEFNLWGADGGKISSRPERRLRIRSIDHRVGELPHKRLEWVACRPSSDAELQSGRWGPKGLNQTLWDEVDQFSRTAARRAGRSITFTLACVVILLWITTGPLFHYSDTWQLAINTATTIVTFLMVFLIQHTQNRDAEAVQIKLDELIRATKGAHNALLDLEELTEQQQDYFRDKYEAIAREAQQNLLAGEGDTDSPELG